MKNFSLLCTALLMILPGMSMATPCSCPAYNYNYTGDVKGHSATIIKTQTYQAATQTCTISSVITVKAFITKIVNQEEVGICSNSSLTSQTFFTDVSGSKQPVILNVGEFGPLFFALYLNNAIHANNTVCPPSATVRIDDSAVPMQCTQITPNVTVTTGAGQTLSATRVTYTALDNSTSLTYEFSDGQLVSMSSPTSLMQIDKT